MQVRIEWRGEEGWWILIVANEDSLLRSGSTRFSCSFLDLLDNYLLISQVIWIKCFFFSCVLYFGWGYEHRENKWCGYDYPAHFNIYEGIIVKSWKKS